jgi:hypothetical protein
MRSVVHKSKIDGECSCQVLRSTWRTKGRDRPRTTPEGMMKKEEDKKVRWKIPSGVFESLCNCAVMGVFKSAVSFTPMVRIIKTRRGRRNTYLVMTASSTSSSTFFFDSDVRFLLSPPRVVTYLRRGFPRSPIPISRRDLSRTTNIWRSLKRD